MFIRALMLVTCAVQVLAFLKVEDEECEVRLRTDTGWVCGRVRLAEGVDKYASFRGVPYGNPPLGQRRFSVLEPPDPWDYLLDATEDSPACPQKDMIYGRMARQPRGQSEDCIYMNIHVPYAHFPNNETIGNDKGLPIMVMVHGGGFHSGSGLTDVHGPEYLITQKVIVISFNYRINVFGFLSLGTCKVPGNQGLRDVLRALRWIKQHSVRLGGDPDNVTLMGQSCGASVVHLLSLSKAAEGLFNRIFIMSGHAVPNYFTTEPQFAKEIAADFLKYLGIDPTDPDVIHDALVKMPIEAIMEANNYIQYDYGLTSFVPVEEEECSDVETVLEASPLKLIGQGRGSQYPMLFGFTENEVVLFKWLSSVWQMPQRIEHNNALTLPRRLSYAYSIARLGNLTAERCFHGNYSMDNYINCYNYLLFIYPMLKIAEWRGITGAPAYLYKFTYESERSIVKEALWMTYKGAAHLEDMTYLYRTNSMLEDYVSFPPKNNDDLMKLWWVKIATNFMKCKRFAFSVVKYVFDLCCWRKHNVLPTEHTEDNRQGMVMMTKCNPTCTVDEAQWPPVRAERLQYQEIGQPMVYKMKDPDAEEVDWVRYFDEVDLQVRNVTNELMNNM